jgi:uncharacterized protein (DUF885 family)
VSTHRSAMFALADAHVERAAAMDPQTASWLGVPGSDHLLTDHSPDAVQARAAMSRSTLADLDSTPIIDDIDRVAAQVMRERISADLGLLDSGEAQQFMSVLWSPSSETRQIFEMMPHSTADERATISSRMARVGAALESWRASLEESAAQGRVTSRRQVLGVADQLLTYSQGSMSRFVERICGANGVDVPAELASNATAADASFGDMGIWLRDTLAPQSPTADGVGRERYALWARNFNGADLDLDAIYAWGWEDLERITSRMEACASTIDPAFTRGSSFLPIVEALDSDPANQRHGTDSMLAFLRDVVEGSFEAMADKHFDIDPGIRVCEVRLAPEGSAAAPHYTGPSEDLSRPGISWLPVVGDSDVFTTWRHVSIWYHEAVPGHHLQIATATVERERLSRFQRTFGSTSGYAEGWALYAEKFMDELGFFDSPGVEMGYLSSQAMRAARVVVDIGMHLGLTVPVGTLLNGQDIGGRIWDADLGREFMIGRALLEPAFAASEIDRYLGIPGQAISYKVGEKVFLEAREEAKSRLGAGFDLKAWHMFALHLGGMGLDTLTAEMAAWQG